MRVPLTGVGKYAPSLTSPPHPPHPLSHPHHLRPTGPLNMSSVSSDEPRLDVSLGVMFERTKTTPTPGGMLQLTFRPTIKLELMQSISRCVTDLIWWCHSVYVDFGYFRQGRWSFRWKHAKEAHTKPSESPASFASVASWQSEAR